MPFWSLPPIYDQLYFHTYHILAYGHVKEKRKTLTPDWPVPDSVALAHPSTHENKKAIKKIKVPSP
jgi:hypothetical protein